MYTPADLDVQLFCATDDTMVVLKDYPSLANPGSVFYGVPGVKTDYILHPVNIGTVPNLSGERSFTVPTLRLHSWAAMHGNKLSLKSVIYNAPEHRFNGTFSTFTWSDVDRTGFTGYTCEYLIKNESNGFIACVIRPRGADELGLYEVYAGTGETLYHVPQYRSMIRDRGGDILHVTLDEPFLRRVGLEALPPGDRRIKPNEPKWTHVNPRAFDRVFSADTMALQARG